MNTDGGDGSAPVFFIALQNIMWRLKFCTPKTVNKWHRQSHSFISEDTIVMKP